MDTKFTPGKWYADFDGVTGRATRVRSTFKGGRDQVCVADCMQGAGSFEALEANAHLISAAPELYEALEILTGNIAMAFPALESLRPVVQARASLAKARGEA